MTRNPRMIEHAALCPFRPGKIVLRRQVLC